MSHLISAVSCRAAPDRRGPVNGSAVTIAPWIDGTAAVLEAWLSGQAVGGAIADVLFGVVNPPAGSPRRSRFDSRTRRRTSTFPGDGDEARYGEGMFIGYRWYDARDAACGVPVRPRPLVYDIPL